MARRRFFVAEIRRGTAEVVGAEADHLVRVLRAEFGQVYEISDNQGLYLAQIEVARKSLVTFRVLEKLPSPGPSVDVTILPALFKFDRFEWLVEKATELGVSTIVPWEAVRTERGLMQASAKRTLRWQKIANEASQQARRAHLPRIEAAIHFRKALALEADFRILLDEDASASPLLRILPEERCTRDRIGILSGPEGGWTEEEREQALAMGWKACSLGPTVLRAETAPIAALSIIGSAWQNTETGKSS